MSRSCWEETTVEECAIDLLQHVEVRFQRGEEEAEQESRPFVVVE